VVRGGGLVLQQCPECRTVVDDDAPYCVACGYQFTKVPAVPSSTGQAGPRSCSIGLLLKKLAASDYFCDFQTDAITVRPELPAITNLAHDNLPTPLDLD
jgi:hypothetical protein